MNKKERAAFVALKKLEQLSREKAIANGGNPEKHGQFRSQQNALVINASARTNREIAIARDEAICLLLEIVVDRGQSL